ncbi:MAG: MBL fold metallo-hydrolase [Kiritimatiellia bacterium]|jgi:phosphoribosyl 1,2-cyclic phosphate phosphodiesterase
MISSRSTAPQVLVLGSGTSTGVPLIGCSCEVCTSADPRDSRLRSSVYVTCDGFAALIDVSPDFRQQALHYKLPRIDAILLTHPHADHVFGLDDIRRFNTIQAASIPAYVRDFTFQGLSRMFSYIVAPPESQKGMYRPQIEFHVTGEDPADIGPFRMTSLEIPHGPTRSTAFKLDYQGRAFVYAPDCSEINDDLRAFIRGAEAVMLDGLRDRAHAGHLTVEKAVAAMREAGVGRGFITHISHDISHAQLERRIAPPIGAAYDGLVFEW